MKLLTWIICNLWSIWIKNYNTSCRQHFMGITFHWTHVLIAPMFKKYSLQLLDSDCDLKRTEKKWKTHSCDIKICHRICDTEWLLITITCKLLCLHMRVSQKNFKIFFLKNVKRVCTYILYSNCQCFYKVSRLSPYILVHIHWVFIIFNI